jgi:hypothetical protein
MSSRQNTYSSWVAARSKLEAWCRQVDAALPPFQRTRPRDPGEASLLRSIGTPEELIGPEPADLTDDDAMALAVEAQHASRPRPR